MRLVLHASWLSLAYAACALTNLTACDTLLWATEALSWSSFYANQPASSALGSPNHYPSYADSVRAWCPRYANTGEEFLVFRFNASVNVGAVEIYETWFPGAISRISVQRDDGQFVVVWRGQTNISFASRVFSPLLACAEKGSIVRIELNTAGRDDEQFYEMDALSIRGSMQKIVGLSACPNTTCTLKCLGGSCVLDGDEVSCMCTEFHTGSLCEFDLQFPVGVLDYSSEQQYYSVTGIEGEPDSYIWRFDAGNFPSRQFVDFTLESLTYAHNVRVYGSAASSVSSVSVMTNTSTWMQVWEGVIALNKTDTEYLNFSCLPAFQTKTLRVSFDLTRLVNATNANIDSIEVKGTTLSSLNSSSSSSKVCVDACPLFLNRNTQKCFSGRCISLLENNFTAQCACPLNTTGEFCGVFFQYVSNVSKATVGGQRLTYARGERDGYGLYYGESYGVVSIVFAFDFPVFLTSYEFFFVDNTSALFLTRISAKGSNSSQNENWISLWDENYASSQGVNHSKALCQPDELVNYLRADFLLPPCEYDCKEIWLDAVLLTGSYDKTVARNNSLSACPSLCTANNSNNSVCQNNQPCISLLDNSLFCDCSLEHGGKFCGDNLNYVERVLATSFSPNQNPLMLSQGLIAFPNIYPAIPLYTRRCWGDDGGCNDSWTFPHATSNGDYTEFLDLRFARSELAVAIALYETSGPGVLTKVLMYNEDHWVEIWVSKNGSNWKDANAPSLSIGREFFSQWMCKPNFSSNRVRLEFNTSLDGNIWNELDAVRLFNNSELAAEQNRSGSSSVNYFVPSAACVDRGCGGSNSSTLCTSKQAGTCVSSANGNYCVCSKNFLGTFCELEEKWPINAFASSDRFYSISALIGPPDMYPLTFSPLPYRFWAPAFSLNTLTLDYNFSQSSYIHAIEFFDSNFAGTIANIISVAVGSDLFVLQEVWRGNFTLGDWYRIEMSTSNWTCLPANFTRVQLTIALGSNYYGKPRFDSVGIISTSTPSLPICTYGTCSPNPCMHGGKCVFSSVTNEKECVCTNGYYGEACEMFGEWWAESVSDISAPYLSDLPEQQTGYFPGALLGPPNVQTMGRDGGGFRFEARDEQGVLLYEYVEVFFPQPVYLSSKGVSVIESKNPGCITRLLAKKRSNSSNTGTETSEYVEIWANERGGANVSVSWKDTTSSLFQPTLQCLPDFAVQFLRVEVNTSLSSGWEEYDAIALLGSLTKPSSSSSSLTCPSLCTPSTCLRGVCVTRLNKDTYCRCSPLWTGPRCDRPSSLQMSMFLRKQFAVITGDSPTEVCYITTQGDLHCHSELARVFSPPPGKRFVQVAITYLFVCALDEGGRAECWDRDTGASYFVANVSLSFIAAGSYSMCGIKTEDSKIQCFICGSGYNNFCDVDQETKFISLVVGEEPVSCALSWAGQPVCSPFLDFSPPQWSNNEPPVLSSVQQLDIGDSVVSILLRCFLFTNGSVSCQNRSSTRVLSPLTNSEDTPWGNVVVGDHGDVCGVYAETGIISCQDDSNNFNLGGFSGQSGFLAMQADHMRGSNRNRPSPRVMCAIDSLGGLICTSTPTNPMRFTFPSWANVTLPCDFQNGGCGENMRCTNVVRGVKCECPSGFKIVEFSDLGYADCEDIDECALRTLTCPAFQYCMNLLGSAECRDYITPRVNHVLGCDSVLSSNAQTAQQQYHPENCSTAGNQLITFCGSDIIAESVIVIGRGAGECTNVIHLPTNSTLVVNNSTVFCPQSFSCMIPEGRGSSIDLSLLRGGQTIETNFFYSYASPTLFSLGGCVEECSRITLPRPALELYGENFGSTPVVLVGGASCALLSHNHTFISCSLPSGRGVPSVSVVAGGQISNFLSLTYASCREGETDVVDQRNLTCVKCARGYAKGVIGSSPCTLCAAGKYAVGVGAVKCLDCVQSGLTCNDGFPTAEEQYWGFFSSQTNQFAVVHCPPNHCLEANKCVEGREQTASNVLCARCEENLINWGSTCVECENEFHFGLFFFMILLCELFLVFTHLMKRGSQKAGVTRLLVYFVQISLVMSGSSQLHISFLNIVNFDLATASSAISNSCVFKITPERQLVVLLLQPLIFLAVLLFNFGFRHATWRLFSKICIEYKRLKSWQKRPTVNGYFRSGLALLLFAYSSTCTKVFQFLRCQEVHPEGMPSVNVMFYYPTISCDDEFYGKFRPLVIFVLVFYVLGFPIMSLCLLSFWKSKGLLEEKKNGRWGVLYELYQTRVFFWQSVELFLRFIFALIDSQFSNDYLVRASLFSFVNLTALLAQIASHPYTNAQVNKLESVVHSILLCLAFLLSTDATGNVPVGASWVFFTFVILVVILLAGTIAYHKISALWTFYTHTRTRMKLAQKGETALEVTEMTSHNVEAFSDPAKQV